MGSRGLPTCSFLEKGRGNLCTYKSSASNETSSGFTLKEPLLQHVKGKGHRTREDPSHGREVNRQEQEEGSSHILKFHITGWKLWKTGQLSRKLDVPGRFPRSGPLHGRACTLRTSGSLVRGSLKYSGDYMYLNPGVHTDECVTSIARITVHASQLVVEEDLRTGSVRTKCLEDDWKISFAAKMRSYYRCE